jgi:hypothetical protein
MDTYPEGTAPKRRPDFLLVLCILTFLGSGFGLINACTNYINADVLTEIARDALEKSKHEAGKEFNGRDKKLAEKMITGVSSMMDPEKLKQNYLLTFIGNLLTLAGGILMFRLRKAGFWVYIVGTVLLVATPVIIFGVGNIFSLGITLMVGIGGILFIVLYSLNLKYLS